MKTFLRENLMIVVSIALPLLIVLFFFLASILPGVFSTPPAYDLLVSLQERGTSVPSQVKVGLVVKGERLKAIVSKTDRPYYGNNPRLFRYSHVSGQVNEIKLPLPESMSELNDGAEIPIPALAELRVSEALQAPDGYEFRRRNNGGGLMTEMFGGSRNRTDVSIAKNGAIVRVRLPTTDYWYNEVQFLGWVIE